MIDSAGGVIAEAVAAAPRDDLVGVGNGKCDFAFKVGVPFTDIAGPVRIFADDVEIPGSPLFLDAHIFDGELAIAGGVASGWVCNRHSQAVRQTVTLTDQDGHAVMSVTAHPDLDSDDPLFAPSRFSAPLPAACFGRTELCLTGRVGGNPFARAIGTARLDGYLDSVTRDSCAGWLFSPDAPERRFDLVVYRDGVRSGSGSTRIFRHDVASRYPGAGACGFELALRHASARPDGLAISRSASPGRNGICSAAPSLSVRARPRSRTPTRRCDAPAPPPPRCSTLFPTGSPAPVAAPAEAKYA